MGEETLKHEQTINKIYPSAKEDVLKQQQRRYSTLPIPMDKEGIIKPPGQTCGDQPLVSHPNPISKNMPIHTIHLENNLTNDGSLQTDDPKDGPTGQNVVGQYDHRLPLMAYQNTLIINIKQILKEQFIKNKLKKFYMYCIYKTQVLYIQVLKWTESSDSNINIQNKIKKIHVSLQIFKRQDQTFNRMRSGSVNQKEI
ncbi:hypothetical protein ABPG72_018585 [Tetrahymena utriculariae]